MWAAVNVYNQADAGRRRALDAVTRRRCPRTGSGVALRVSPDPDEDEVAGWELFTPAGMYLQAGPGPRWRYASADEPEG